MTQAGEAKTAALFTPESANRALPYVRAVVEDLVAAFARRAAAESARSRTLGGKDPRGREEALRHLDAERHAAQETLLRVGRELEAVGVDLKDPEKGLVDFPAEREGRRVYLCWRRGEESVAFWHDIESGFAGRRPLVDPSSAGEASPV